MSGRQHAIASTSIPSTPDPDGFEQLDLSSEQSWDEAQVQDHEIIPAEPVTPWANALEHSRTAAGNMLHATSQFSHDFYHSGLGSAAIAVAAATYSTLTLQAGSTKNRIRRPRSIEEKASDAVGGANLTHAEMLERVPIAVMGADIDGPDYAAMHTRPPTRRSTSNRVIAGPAQRRHGANAEGPIMLQSPANLPPYSYSSSPYSTEEQMAFPFAYEDAEDEDADDEHERRDEEEEEEEEENEFVMNKELYDDAIVDEDLDEWSSLPRVASDFFQSAAAAVGRRNNSLPYSSM